MANTCSPCPLATSLSIDNDVLEYHVSCKSKILAFNFAKSYAIKLIFESSHKPLKSYEAIYILVCDYKVLCKICSN